MKSGGLFLVISNSVTRAEDFRSLGSGVTDVSEPPGGYWKPNLGLLQEQLVLLTSQHLSSPKYCFLDYELGLQRRGVVLFHFVLVLFFCGGWGTRISLCTADWLGTQRDPPTTVYQMLGLRWWTTTSGLPICESCQQ